MNIDKLLEQGKIPDSLIRMGIRKLNKQRLKEETKEDASAQQEHFQSLVDFLRNSPVAVQTDKANEQHYELPTEFYELVLGKHKKYSGCLWLPGTSDLSVAEEAMLSLYLKRAELNDGQSILELGCGWGSLTLYMAEKLPKAKITAVSNSSTQKKFIDEEAKKRNLKNIQVITADMNEFKIRKTFDRVVSIEMFEHMRNYEELFSRVHSWLKKDGKLFIHIFSHKSLAYFFEEKDETDWMGRYFFSGGIMPSNHLMLYFADGFRIEDHQVVNGQHYEKTAEAWLWNMDANIEEIRDIFKQTYGPDWKKWINYWRVFFMACAELFGTNEGNEWYVSHYLFSKKN